jgi:hypothetical protein
MSRLGEAQVKAFDLDPSLTWLFCMTHPDDEISICAWIRKLAQNGNRVYISWTHSNRIRENEARAAAHLLGVPANRLFFFGATDGAACDEIPDLLPQFRAMMEQVKPDRVVCGAFEQGHIDHDTTNFLVNNSYDGAVFEVPFYHTYTKRVQKLNRFSDRSGQEIRRLTAEERAFKKLIAKQYPSQKIWKILFWYELCSAALLRPALLPMTERMRLQSHRRWLAPNHPPTVARRVELCTAWQRWVNAVIVAESRLLLTRSAAGDREVAVGK